ncbi:MAG: hypothetical protein JWM98_2478 [Thermoleophilia bacterium]|nr:hypothetical protein [Thermoleophilia bacterium]
MISAPSARSCYVPPTPPAPPTGYGSPIDQQEEGWLGQVPPPPPTPPAPACAQPEAPTFAIPQLAPDPWLEPPALYPDDPTLFG